MYEAINFYEPLSRADAKRHERGQFWWTCFPYAFDGPEVMRYRPNRPSQKLDIRQFDPSKEASDDSADTDPSEFLAIAKFKKRPAVIISTAGTPYKGRAWSGGEFFLVAPVYSLRDECTGEYRALPEFVWNAITYRYSSVFYLPRDDTFDIHEATLHFDQMTTLHRSWLLEPRKARLTGEAMNCLDEWLYVYLCGKVRRRFNRDLADYREMVGSDPQIRTGVFGRGEV